MENFALISLVAELRERAVGMRVRRIARYSGRVFALESRSGTMQGLRISLDPRAPSIRVPGALPAQETTTNDFVMVLRKHLISSRLSGIEKPLSERIVELRFQTSLPTEELREVTLVVELIPNTPNLVLLDANRRVLSAALPPARHRGVVLYDTYRYPETDRIPLETILQEAHSWLDDDAFTADPERWLLGHLAGVGPVLAGELAARAREWKTSPGGIAGGIGTFIDRLQEPARTAWIHSDRPLSVIVQQGDLEALRRAIVSPVELTSLRGTHSFQSHPGMLTALRAVADPMEAAALLERERARELRRLAREAARLDLRRRRLEERKKRFSDASLLGAQAGLLVASGADMDRHHEAVTVIEYAEEGARRRTIRVDASRTLRENVQGMFRKHQKAGRGLSFVDRQLARLEQEAEALSLRERQVRGVTHWHLWRAAQTKPASGGATSVPSLLRPRRRGRSVSIEGRDILVGRNSRENDELTFRVAAADDFWLHVADYSGSHVIVRNPSRSTELDPEVLIRAAQLAAYHSQARNSRRVEVHYTQRKFVGKPKKAPPGLVRLRRFSTITVEPRDWTRDPPNRKPRRADNSNGNTAT